MITKNESIVAEVRKSFVGNKRIVQKVLVTMLAGGHVLLEDIPGVGKTTLAVAFTRAMELSCNRIQFTPDVMPTDVTGFTMLRPDTQIMEYQPGAVMCNFLLADEINRASTRTQAALLEAMEENSVTVDGVTHQLPQPFMVIATQNPTGSSGTQLLPESQTDRFMSRLSIGYPDEQDEFEMMVRKHGYRQDNDIDAVTNAADLLQMQKQVSRVYIKDEIYQYILRLTRATREHKLIQQGASPRCTVSLMSLAQAVAYISGRDYVIPEDVRSMYIDCTAHRLILTPEAKRDKLTPEAVLLRIMESIKQPELKVV